MSNSDAMRLIKFYLSFFVVLTLGLSFFVQNRKQSPYPDVPGPIFDKYIRNSYMIEIQTQEPDLVLLGDSTLSLGIDKKNLSALTGKKVYMISNPGTASAVWYLIIKSNLADSPYKPPYLIIFFRDTMLTTPEFNVTGKYQTLVDEFAPSDDRLLLQLAYINQMKPVEQIMERYLPIYHLRLIIRAGIERRIRYVFVGKLTGLDLTTIDEAMNSVFEFQDLYLDQNLTDNTQAGLYTPEHLNFENQVNQSFLPEIIRLSKENDTQLIFVHLRTSLNFSPQTEPNGLAAYISALEMYLHENNAYFLDFAHDERLKPKYFRDGVHLNPQGQKLFTVLLADALKPLIK